MLSGLVWPSRKNSKFIKKKWEKINNKRQRSMTIWKHLLFFPRLHWYWGIEEVEKKKQQYERAERFVNATVRCWIDVRNNKKKRIMFAPFIVFPLHKPSTTWKWSEHWFSNTLDIYVMCIMMIRSTKMCWSRKKKRTKHFVHAEIWR